MASGFAAENAALNQYWYSCATIEALNAGALELAARGGGGGGGRVAFLSTPSLYFGLPADRREGHALLDIDAQWQSDPGFVRFDFNEGAAGLPAAARGAFDVVVIDPPFITEAVWRRYAEAALALLRGAGNSGGHVICTTVAENEALLAGLFPGCAALPFQPSIPHLVYQYNTFSTARPPPASLAGKNPEIPE
jgi:hypothetical protein